MRSFVVRLLAVLLGICLVEIPCWGVESVTLQDMLGAHMDRVMRKSGILLPTRHGEPFTNWFGRVVMEGSDALPSGYNYIQLRDSDGWAEVRDEDGVLTREVEPLHSDAAFVLGDLFGFVPSEDTPPELRLSHLVSKWLVCHSEEEADEVDLTDDELRELASARARRIPRLASAPLVVTNLMVTAIKAESDRVTFVTEWPSSMTFPNNRLDLYTSVDLRSAWALHGSYDVAGVNAITTTVMKASIAGYLEGQRAQHDDDCYITTNIVASAFESGVAYTNRHWNCDHKARVETPGFFRWADQTDSDEDGITDAAERWVYDYEIETTLPCNDSDNDGISDEQEIGYIEKKRDFEWYDTTGWMTTYGERQDGGLSGYWGATAISRLINCPVMLGINMTGSISFESGVVFLYDGSHESVWFFPEVIRPLNENHYNFGNIMIAAYWNGSRVDPDDTSSYIRTGIVQSNNCFVAEFRNVKSGSAASKMTYQIIVPGGTNDSIRISYLCSDTWMDGDGAVVGVQNKLLATTDGCYNLTWDFSERGPLLPQTTVEYHLGYGTNPLRADTDMDGMSDYFELFVSRSDPLKEDSDSDGLTDYYEYYVFGTNLMSDDTDNDYLLDKWEIDYGLNPLSAVGDDGWRADIDGDGLSNYGEYYYSCSPRIFDTDGDGLSDGDEVLVYETDPARTDSDGDGVSDGEELRIGTNPIFIDSDSDGLPDGWEIEYGLNPLSSSGVDGASGDMDCDGLCNYDECQLACNPNDADSDGDGTSDFQEIYNGSNPADATDCGIESPRYPYRGLKFNIYGDYAAWQMTIIGLDEAAFLETFSMASPGVGNERLKVLKKGHSYRLTMHWLNSYGYTNPYSWYCWQAKINGLPTNSSYLGYSSIRLPGNEVVYGPGWMVENSDGLLSGHVHTHDGAGGNVAEGLEAVLHVYKCEVIVCDPNRETWQEMDESTVLLDNEVLRVMIKITPAIPSFELCRVIMGDNVVIKTSGTCPEGVSVPISEQEFSATVFSSEIKITKTRTQLIALGLLPANNDDGVLEKAAFDVGNIAGNDGSNLSDTFAFERMLAESRGRASNERSLTLKSSTSNAKLSESFLKAAGSEVLTVCYAYTQSELRQVMNQADYFYYSGHGYHALGLIDDYAPDTVDGWWNRDIDCVVIAGCSVLDINDYNNNYLFSPEDHIASPGKLWNAIGPDVMLGYNYYAPADSSGEPTKIAQKWVSRRLSRGDVGAWMDANNCHSGHNACAIEKDLRYHYFKKKRFGFYKYVVVPKGDW